MKEILQDIKKYFKANDEILSFFTDQSIHQIQAVIAEKRKFNTEITEKLLKVRDAIKEEKEAKTLDSDLFEEETYTKNIKDKISNLENKLRKKKENLIELKEKRQNWLLGLGICKRLQSVNLDESSLKWVVNRKQRLEYLLKIKVTKANIKILESEIVGLEAQIKAIKLGN